MASERVWCGCYYFPSNLSKSYLPMVNLEAKATILNNTSQTHLWQTFCNPSASEPIERCVYTFPLYDGVSVVSFRCLVADRVLEGTVKEKIEAKRTFDEAVSRGETAGLLVQSDDEADVFSTIIGNVPADGSVEIEICYVGELAHDAEADGIRYTIPTKIAPRYGPNSTPPDPYASGVDAQGMSITVDTDMRDGSVISKIESPSHMISVSLGVLSDSQDQEPELTKASATLSLEETVLNQDFVLIVKVKGIETPHAVLETHSYLPNHRAIMATLVPRFALPPIRPEIVFIVDRSGSMSGSNITMVTSAMKVFLKSLVPGVTFNICCFGSRHEFLWSKSQEYGRSSLIIASDFVSKFKADMGGTNTQTAIEAVVENRFGDIPLEIILLTDGDITRQQSAFEYLNKQVYKSKGQIRLFPLGIGSGVSHSLIQGLARAGNGFAQSVQHGERLDTRLMRMFKGALSPHITDYTLEIQYGDEDDFEMVDNVADESDATLDDPPAYKDIGEPSKPIQKKPISLFDQSSNPDADSEPAPIVTLPDITKPVILQAPHKLNALFPFQRTTAYLLLSPSAIQKNPTSVTLRGTSDYGPLHLKIPVEVLDKKGSTIHALAARKATQDLEEGRGWVHDAKDELTGTFWREQVPSQMDAMVKREAVRLGTTFQVANRFCSFVAVDANTKKELVAERVRPEMPVNVGFSRKRELSWRLGKPKGGGPKNVRAQPSAEEVTLLSYSYCSPPQSPRHVAALDSSMNSALYCHSPPPSPAPLADDRCERPVLDAVRRAIGSDRAGGRGFGPGGGRGGGRRGGRFEAKTVTSASDESMDYCRGQSNTTPLSTDAKVRELIDIQDFEGWWEADERIASLVGVDMIKLLESVDVGSRVWTTAIVITCFETSAKSEEEIWEMVVTKAKTWLENQGANVPVLQTRAKEVMGV